jgi:hypothetical protein
VLIGPIVLDLLYSQTSRMCISSAVLLQPAPCRQVQGQAPLYSGHPGRHVLNTGHLCTGGGSTLDATMLLLTDAAGCCCTCKATPATAPPCFSSISNQAHITMSAPAQTAYQGIRAICPHTQIIALTTASYMHVAAACQWVCLPSLGCGSALCTTYQSVLCNNDAASTPPAAPCRCTYLLCFP